MRAGFAASGTTSDRGRDSHYDGRYVDLASRTEGASESICDEDFSPIAYELGLTVSGLELDFELSEACDENSLEVKLYDDATDDSLIGELVNGADFSFIPETNSIHFVFDQVPPSETWIVAEYRILATGSGVGEGR